MSSDASSTSSSVHSSTYTVAESDLSTTVFFGNLHPYVQQQALLNLCSYFGRVEHSKVVSGQGKDSAGYGFTRFADRKSAEAALQALNGKMYLGEELKVNWALPNNHKDENCRMYHLFIGDLGNDVSDAALYNAFSVIGQCADARVMWDHTTGRSKGYGFISFYKQEDAEKAIREMQETLIGSRRIRVGWAQHKQDDNASPLDAEVIDRADPFNTNVYIGNIAPETSEADLSDYFSVHGPVTEAKIHKKGCYGFVLYERHDSAVQAIVEQHGQKLHGRVLKCSWGKNIARSSSSGSSVSLEPAFKAITEQQQQLHIKEGHGRVRKASWGSNPPRSSSMTSIGNGHMDPSGYPPYMSASLPVHANSWSGIPANPNPNSVSGAQTLMASRVAAAATKAALATAIAAPRQGSWDQTLGVAPMAPFTGSQGANMLPSAFFNTIPGQGPSMSPGYQSAGLDLVGTQGIMDLMSNPLMNNGGLLQADSLATTAQMLMLMQRQRQQQSLEALELQAAVAALDPATIEALLSSSILSAAAAADPYGMQQGCMFGGMGALSSAFGAAQML